MKSKTLLIYVFLISIGMPLVAIAESTGPCEVATTSQINQLFNQWNAALQTVDARKVVALYAENAILLPTLSNKPRTNHQEIEKYFTRFVKKHPYGKIDHHVTRSGCNWATDTGLYTFSFNDAEGKKPHTVSARFSFTYEYINDKWLIVSHHSSLLPNIVDPKKDKA